MDITWTCSVVTPLWPVTELYLRTTAWKWPPSWVITTGLSGGDNQGRSCPDWTPTLEIQAGDSQLDYVDAFTLLGDAMHPAYGHPKMLARAYDQVYHEGWEIGNLPLRGKKMVDQSKVVYRVEYTQIIHRFSTLTRIDSEKFVTPMPTSLICPEMIYPGKKYEAYCLKAMESRLVVQYEPISDYQMDGLQPRIDLRSGTEIPVYLEDEVDADAHLNEYPPYEEFVEGPDWTPGWIPPKIRSPGIQWQHQ